MQPGILDAIAAERPDWVLVYGDTASTLAGARAAREAAFLSPTSSPACAAATGRCRRSTSASRSTHVHAPALPRRAIGALSSRGRSGGPHRGRGRRDGRRLGPAGPDRARALDDPRAARPRAWRVPRRDGPPRGERRAAAARADRRRAQPISTSRSSSPRTRVRAPRSTGSTSSSRPRSACSSRSATSTWPHSPPARA